jgi:hypothetical protein
MALQPFVGPWPLLQFRNLFYTDGRTPWESDQPVIRLLPTQRQHKHRIYVHINIHALSGIRTSDRSVRASENTPCLRQRGHCDRPITDYLSVNFNFLILYKGGRTPWTEDQPVAKPLPTYRTQTQNKRTQTYMLLVGFEPKIPTFEQRSEDCLCLRSRGHCDWSVTD